MFLRRSTLVILSILIAVADHAQTCDPFVNPLLFGQAENAIFCRNVPIGFGVSNSAGDQLYTFNVYTPNGELRKKKGGPLTGNGSQLSVAAKMSSARDAGQYRVVTYNLCGEKDSVSFMAYYGNIDNLRITEWGSNSVTFQWSACGPTSDVEYEYAVSRKSTPDSASDLGEFIPTSDTTRSVGSLTSGATYYIHVRVKQVLFNGNQVYIYNYSPPNSCNELPYQTLKFVACSGSPTIGSINPSSATICVGGSTILTASGGTSYQWYYENNTPIPGYNTPAYTATQKGLYKAYITTNAGCSGIVYSAIVTDTLLHTGDFFGGGVYCLGDSVKLGLNNTVCEQTYIIRKDGIDIATLQGIGNPYEAGSPDSIWYKFKITSASQAGVYSVRAISPYCSPQDFGNVNVGLFSGPITGLIVYDITEATATFNWNLQGSGEANYEWAFTITPSPPTTGNGIINFNPVLFYGLVPATQYYFHIRPACSGANLFAWTSIGFTTLPVTPPNCTTPVTLQACTNIVANLPTGQGAWDFAGTYPDNSVGFSTPGKEVIYSFTPSQTGVYYLDVSANYGTINYLYRKASAVCSNSGWTGIRAINTSGKYPVGLLQANTEYLFVLDNNELLSASQTFKICKANVSTSFTQGFCRSAIFSSYIVPANSTKEEYFIDTDGNLIAGLNFSQVPVPTNLSDIFVGYFVYTAGVRHDDQNRKYLSRNFTISSTNNIASGPITFKLFFNNSELQALVNDPDAGFADVTSISDLGASLLLPDLCMPNVTGLNPGSFLKQSGNGVYDATSSYVAFSTNFYSSFYLNGGNSSLNYSVIPDHFQDFSNDELPVGWSQKYLSGTASVDFRLSSNNPSTTAFGVPHFAWWNSYFFANNTETRFISPPIKTIGTPSVTTEFYWYNNNGPYNAGAYLNEGVQVEYSLDGVNWLPVGAFIPRQDNTLPSGTGQWRKIKITLPANAGNQNYIYVAFKFHSSYGDNCGLDAVSFIKTPGCNLQVAGLTTSSITENSVNFNWTAIPGALNYQYLVSTIASPPFSGIITTGTTVSQNSLSASTIYYIHVRAQCTAGNYTSWNTLPFTTIAGPPDCNTAQYISLNVVINATIPAGAGLWDFSGTYPNNSDGWPTPGRERLYKFIAPETGVYYIEMLSITDWLDYFIKNETAGCGSTGWTGVDDLNSPTKRALGMLTGGETYLILLDNETTTIQNHSFIIRKATVLPPTNDLCLDMIQPNNVIPANSPKEEYLLDNLGNVIASLDFHNVTNSVGIPDLSYYVNGGPIRRDVGNREYLDRNFSITTEMVPAGPVGIKLFFTNAELQRLINEPDDGLADVATISDLKVTRIQSDCSGSAYQGPASLMSSVLPGANGSYSSYIAFNTPDLSTSFFIHGGQVALQAVDNIICPSSSGTSFSTPPVGSDYSYVWQVDNGSGFNDLTNSGGYSGVATTTLIIINPSTSFNGYKYRCVATNGVSTVISAVRTLKFAVTWKGTVNSSWENAANWDCGVVPDVNTDVIVENTGLPPVISINVSCKSVLLQTGVHVTVNSGFKLTITGQ